MRTDQYGQIHMCVRSLVLEKFGEEKWKEILEASGCDGVDDFLTFHRYDDSMTLKLIGAVVEVLGVPLPTVLELFGEYFLTYCMDCGYDKMLSTLGENFKTFIQNLDGLHAFLAFSYKNMDAPSFRCEEQNDGTLLLHYYSGRKGLHHIVLGVCRAVGLKLYKQDVAIEIVSQQDEVYGERTLSHVIFKVRFKSQDKEDQEAEKAEAKKHSYIPDSALISPSSFCQILPFHILFDRQLVIKQCGSNIARWSPRMLNAGTDIKLSDVFQLLVPEMEMTFGNFVQFCNATYLLEGRSPDKKSPPPPKNKKGPKRTERSVILTLKGQMVFVQDCDLMLFIGSPRLQSLDEMVSKNLFISDIPLYDVTRELVLLNQQRIAELEVSKRLDETTAELKKTGMALEKEKEKTDFLLYQMLPEKVANALRDGQKVEAEKFEQGTILFSDIVTFTNIAAAVQPMQIVNMLNAMYVRFDMLTETHTVYKVETIGDAYMIVGGVPDRTPLHCQRVAQFSLDMVVKAAEVRSPATDKPLQIRVGIHSGPIVSGVVGHKMPRYCLFGDTVNTASRMESHGVPGRVHVSPFAYAHLKDHDFEFEDRGPIEIKGKGQMNTYFLIASGGKRLEDMLANPQADEKKEPEPAGKQDVKGSPAHSSPAKKSSTNKDSTVTPSKAGTDSTPDAPKDTHPDPPSQKSHENNKGSPKRTPTKGSPKKESKPEESKTCVVL